ncbi:MAG: glutathione peroxidase [Parvibaculales bacterium]
MTKSYSALSLALGTVLLLGLFCAAHAGDKTPHEKTMHDFVLPAIDGGEMSLAQFKGKTILLVNTASYCGFTKQYDGLQALWEEKRDAGLVVLGVPSNDFGRQEPGGKDQIKEFCEVNFAIDFPMSDKLVVKGANAHPLYQWLKAETGAAPRWNFYKFLIDGKGRPIDSYSSMTKPQSKKLRRAIEASLARK